MEGDKTISTPSDGPGDGFQKIRAFHGRTTGPARRSTKGQWTPEEDEILQKAVQRFKGKNWKKIAECFKDRTDVQCLHRWQKVLNPELVKGPWSKEEDEAITALVKKYGPKKWSTIAQHLPGRIGKQCRERWHNHLNPGINKEAWTQQEELALIRAHQIYGNKWAELTKFLPGRTDNAIKNHWNSSVKKKLDSYLASGLLSEFQLAPHLVSQTQPAISSSSRVHSSGDESVLKAEGEEISECSQDSAIKSGRDMSHVVLQPREYQPNRDSSGLRKDQLPGPASCSEQYYASLNDVTYSIHDIPQQEGCSSQFCEQNFPHDPGNPSSIEYEPKFHDLTNISSQRVEQKPSPLQTDCMAVNGSHDLVHAPFQTSVGLVASNPIGFTTLDLIKPEHMLIPDEECCGALFSESINDGCMSSGDFIKGMEDVHVSRCTSFISQTSNIHLSETGGTTASQPCSSPRCHNSNGISCSQSLLSVPSVLSADNGRIVYTAEGCQFYGCEEQRFFTCTHDDFVYVVDSENDDCYNTIGNNGMQEHSDFVKCTSNLVPVNSFGCESDMKQPCPPMEDKPTMHINQEDTGSLCYEPPRFPSLDIPFFSCDLIQSGSDMQQEYSPLGIRQLMMSSMNCLTPLKLWDSPSHCDSPDAVLKSAARTFTGTPSILKKRHRDLLSPLSDRRNEKKLETDVTCALTQDFSRLEVLFDDNETQEEGVVSPSSIENEHHDTSDGNKENCGQIPKAEELEGVKDTAIVDDRKSEGIDNDNSVNKIKPASLDVNNKKSEKDIDNGHSLNKTKAGTLDIDAASEIVQQPSGVLVEHNMNDMLLHSPDQLCFRKEKALCSSARTPKFQRGKIMETPSTSISSPTICSKRHETHSARVTCLQSFTSSVPEESSTDNAGFEAFSIFCGTPFRRSIESPSAWKSPWFTNAFLPGSRIDSEFTFEDIGIGCFHSPGDRSYDAIGLMKQISEQTAAACATAQEVLGNDTPKTMPKDKSGNCKDLDQENSHHKTPAGDHPQMALNAWVERRVLDFSECGTPNKGTENGKSSAMSFSSPSSYLLKGCR